MNPARSWKREMLCALAATLIFWLMTFRTGYPFLVDDYIFAHASYLPGYSLKTYMFLLSQRPVMAIVNYLSYGAHLFERTKLPFLVYFWLYSMGLLGILRFLADLLSPPSVRDFLRRSRWGAVILTLICLYPGWYEINLMALNLPYGLGIPLLGLAVNSRSAVVRGGFLFLAFATFETYPVPAFMLLALEAVAPRPFELRRCKRAALTWGAAMAGYFALQQTLSHFVAPTRYGIPSQWFTKEGLYLKLLWGQSFYKMNWVSTALELAALGLAAFWLVRRERKHGAWIVALAVAVPCLAIQHIALVGYYAPRAIYGGSVVRMAFVGLLLAELFSRMESGVRRSVVLGLLGLAYLGHYGLIVSNRTFNREILDAARARIEREISECSSSCSISTAGLESEMRWDWMMTPVFHQAYVEWIRDQMGVSKEVRAVD